jgi:hypothetical protein
VAAAWHERSFAPDAAGGRTAGGPVGTQLVCDGALSGKPATGGIFKETLPMTEPGLDTGAPR